MPYISASIIMQLMTVAVPSLEALKKEGEAGRRKITQYTRYGTWLWPCSRDSASPSRWNRRPGWFLIRDDVPFRYGADPGYRHHVPDVAGRADHRARSGQRHFHHHLRRYRRRFAQRDGGLFELVRTGAMHPFGLFICALFLVTGFVVFVERASARSW
jgi:preprotein translocase subunit SecY